MTNQNKIKTRIKNEINTGNFLFRFMQESVSESSSAQEDLVDRLTEASTYLSAELRRYEIIKSVGGDSDYWKTNRGMTAAFIDGGVAQIDIPYALPVGIRVGSYIVETGRNDENREHFTQEMNLVEDLFGESIYDSEYDDNSRQIDAARILCESSVALRLAESEKKIDAILLHGPLINPASPYGMDDFPNLSVDFCSMLLDRPPSNFEDSGSRSFVSIYQEIQRRLFCTERVVAGVVERTKIRNANVILRSLEKKLPKSDYLDIVDLVEDELKLSDQQICSLVLEPGEYLEPVLDNRQGSESHWPNRWKSTIRRFPEAQITYMKPSEISEPFRVEINDSNEIRSILKLVYQTSKLLPKYGFPVGLDIVDKFAKVPSWMSRRVRGQHAIALLKAAIQDGNKDTIKFAKNVLLAKGRDWLYRPK